MATVRCIILRSPGANCDFETQHAFQQAGARADRVHVNRVLDDPGLLDQYQIFCIPGGFSYGDDVGAGNVLANQLHCHLAEALERFRDAGKLALGICNGFQVLVKAGLLPGIDSATGPCATLTYNDSNKFEDRWTYLEVRPGKCAFLNDSGVIYLPVAHGEGKFVTRDQAAFDTLESNGQIVLRYVNADGSEADYPANPNGSPRGVAGVCDPSGQVLGLMPHPERHIDPTQHPHWTRLGLADEGDGLAFFRNAVAHFA
jgi:phosphoribosylformylglycinamidine synthase subunit PurQ / glutaminase